MGYSQYKFKFYLNASHAIYIQGMMGDRHPHTWEIEISALKQQVEFVQFKEVEEPVEKFLDKFQNGFLNDFEPFNHINPTLENITNYFLTEIQALLIPLGWYVFYMEAGETPTRSYIISLVESGMTSDFQKMNMVNDIIAKSFQDTNNELKANHTL
jgi:6-pyruvoyltetrahydropterin/6-carboxytetrahydropterin synthase